MLSALELTSSFVKTILTKGAGELNMLTGGAGTLGELVERGVLRLGVNCNNCGRAGEFSVARLNLKHGPELGLSELLHVLTRRCPHRMTPGAIARCGAVLRLDAERRS
jgi:hypothetical protein